MRYITKELAGPRLDAAVAKALGIPYSLHLFKGNNKIGVADEWQCRAPNKCLPHEVGPIFCPSSYWPDGLPILDQMSKTSYIQIVGGDGEWSCYTKCEISGGALLDHGPWGDGPTMLIAVMRALVALKIGEAVEL